MKKTIAGLAAVLVALTGCAMVVDQKQIYLPNGKQGYALDCGGQYLNWNSCMEEAGKICGPFGYKEISRNGEKAYSSQNQGAGEYKMGFSQTTYHRTMVIECGEGRFAPPSGTLPTTRK